MKYSEFVDLCVETFFSAEQCAPFQAAMVPYRRIKTFLKTADFESSSVAVAGQLCGDCPICLEPFEARSDYVLTRCAHSFHPHCIARSIFFAGSSFSCPMCRASLQHLLPEGLDGVAVQFICFCLSGLETVEKCHEEFLRYAANRVKVLQALKGSSLTAICDEYRQVRLEGLMHEGQDLCRLLRCSEIFGFINFHSIRRLIEWFDKHSSFRVSAQLAAQLHQSRFYEDCSLHSRGGRIGSLLESLQDSLEVVKIPTIPWWVTCDPHHLTPSDILAMPSPLTCIFVCRSNSARSIVAECVARARCAATSSPERQRLQFYSAGTVAPPPREIKAGVRAALERAGYSVAGLRPKYVGRLLETELRGRPVHCFVTMACDAEADLRRDQAVLSLDGVAPLHVDAAIPAPTRPDVTAEEAAALYDGLVRDVEAMMAGLPALLGGARPLLAPAPAAEGCAAGCVVSAGGGGCGEV